MNPVREVAFDSNAISLDAVKRAAHRLLDRFSAEFAVSGSAIRTALHFEAGKSEDFIEAAVAEFRREALDQDLRTSIKAETETVRNLILAHAFSRTGLIDE